VEQGGASVSRFLLDSLELGFLFRRVFKAGADGSAVGVAGEGQRVCASHEGRVAHCCHV